MLCKKCGYFNAGVVDYEPAMYVGDKKHPNYNIDLDAVGICEKCYKIDKARWDAEDLSYQSSYAYACGYHD
jgi:hypothetical protein